MRAFSQTARAATAFFVCLGFAGGLFASPIVAITNPSFEDQNFTAYPSTGYPAFPGYSATNSSIPGWTGTTPDSPQIRTGINGGTSSTAFASNGVIPDGTHVAFIQSPGAATTLFQALPGLTTGQDYMLTFYDNARTFSTPHLTVTIGTHTLLSNVIVNPVGGTNAYNFVSAPFTAVAGDNAGPTLTFSITGPNSDDSILLDNVVLYVPEPSSAAALAFAGIATMLAVRSRSPRRS